MSKEVMVELVKIEVYGGGYAFVYKDETFFFPLNEQIEGVINVRVEYNYNGEKCVRYYKNLLYALKAIRRYYNKYGVLMSSIAVYDLDMNRIPVVFRGCYDLD